MLPWQVCGAKMVDGELLWGQGVGEWGGVGLLPTHMCYVTHDMFAGMEGIAGAVAATAPVAFGCMHCAVALCGLLIHQSICQLWAGSILVNNSYSYRITVRPSQRCRTARGV